MLGSVQRYSQIHILARPSLPPAPSPLHPSHLPHPLSAPPTAVPNYQNLIAPLIFIHSLHTEPPHNSPLLSPPPLLRPSTSILLLQTTLFISPLSSRLSFFSPPPPHLKPVFPPYPFTISPTFSSLPHPLVALALPFTEYGEDGPDAVLKGIPTPAPNLLKKAPFLLLPQKRRGSPRVARWVLFVCPSVKNFQWGGFFF